MHTGPMARLALAICLLLLAGGAAASSRRLEQEVQVTVPALAGAAPAPVVPPKLPNPESLTAMQLSLEFVGNFTEQFGAGTLYAACRNTSDPAVNATRACESGLQCCGYLGSAAGNKLPDTCVRNSAGTECPRMYPGRAGAPCATDRKCDEGLVCCDARPFLGGLTAVHIPTCQNNESVTDAAGFVFC